VAFLVTWNKYDDDDDDVVRPPQYAPPLQVVTWTSTQSSLMTSTFDLLTLELVLELEPWAVTRTTFLPIFVFLRLFVVQLWANVSDYDYDTIYYLDLWKPLRSPRKSLMRVFVGVGHKPPPGPKPLTKAPPVRSPFGRKPPKTKTLLPPSQTSNKVTL